MIERILGFVLISGIGMTITHAGNPVYIVGNFNGHGYEFIPDPTPWQTAKERAEQAGGYMVVITSPEENEFIKRFIEKSCQGEFCATFIGLTDRENEGTWRWVNGEKYTFQSWFPQTQPDNWGGSENAVEIVKSENLIHWNDISSDRRLPYIIEYNSEIDAVGNYRSRQTKSNLRSTR